MCFSGILLKCAVILFFFFLGYGSNNSSSRTTHRNGTRMGSSIYIADEINTCYFDDAGLVCIRCKFLLNCFFMWICEEEKNLNIKMCNNWAKHITAPEAKIISEQVQIFAVFKQIFYGLSWPIYKNVVKTFYKILKREFHHTSGSCDHRNTIRL